MYCKDLGCWTRMPCPLHVEGTWRVIVLGSGASSGTPKLGCVLRGNPVACVCQSSPFDEKNRRGNPCIVLQKLPTTPQEVMPDGRQKGECAVLVDIGKTFRESARRWLPQFGVRMIDTILFTHHHADAIMGADDLREITPDRRFSDFLSEAWADAYTATVLRSAFPYIFKTEAEMSGKKPSLFIAEVKLRLLEAQKTVTPISDLQVTPMPLHHGEVLSMGFAMHQAGTNDQFVYLSDFRNKSSTGSLEVSDEDILRLSFFVDPEASLAVLKRFPVSTMFLDCLNPEKQYMSHPALPETIAVVKALENHGVTPQHIFFVGMSCVMDYHTFNARLLKEFPKGNVQLAYDGLEFPLTLNRPEVMQAHL